jgi:apolipoprotein N-acyltransferase
MHTIIHNNRDDIIGARTDPYGRKVLFACLSGVMLTAAFPRAGFAFLAWFALVPLLKGLEGENFSRAFGLGLITGATHYLTLMYWIVVVLGRYGNLNILVSLGPLLLLCLYLALFPALFSGLATYLTSSAGLLIGLAGLWVGLEYVRANVLTGFPWCLLGYTQYKHLLLIQIADICGVYGVSFLIVLVNGFFYRLLFARPAGRRGNLGWEAVLVAAAVGITLGYGHYCLSTAQTSKTPGKTLRAVVVQASIDQSIKWDPSHQNQTMATYQRLTRAAYGSKPDLIVWPETSVPFFFQDHNRLAREVFRLADESGAGLLFGSPAYVRSGGRTRYYNRAYLITPGDTPLQYYDKVHLVPFGEYIPFKRLLFFVDRLVPAAGDFEAGDKIVPLRLSDVSIGVLICFEAIFPELARIQTRRGANILINLTNDAWFGRTSAPYQHLSMAVFRAVENRRPMIRAANTGISAFIGSEGKITAQSTLFRKEILSASVEVSNTPLTFYTRYGDLFVLAALLVALSILLFSLSRRWGQKR